MPDLSCFDLSGRVALVTGASRGIGRSIATALGKAGAAVAVTSRSLDALQDTIGTLERSGTTALGIRLDVADVGAIDEAVARAVGRFGQLDILVNNAGTEEVCPSLEVGEALWDRIVDTNLKGAFFCAQAAAKQMTATSRGGVIVNVCSLTSMVGIPTAVPYGSSKSGLLGMTRALAAEWAALGIRVNAIAPGYFRTALTDVFYDNEDWQASMRKRIPAGRFGRLDDLEGVAIFLASDASSYITGECIAIDGGTLASL